MIEACHISKRFDDFQALKELSLKIEKGQLLALLGPNGAGKTTTIRILSAILRPTTGYARINGFDVVTQADNVRRCIGILSEQPGLYDRMTGLEYLTFFGRLYGMNDSDIKERSLALFDRFALPDTADRRLSNYSKGMKQKVGIIRAMLHRPAVLMMDEPTSAMDPESARFVRDAIMELRHDKHTIILCTHNLAEAEYLADRIAIVRSGEILTENSTPLLKQQLLGEPRIELELDRPLNGEISSLQELVDVEENAGTIIRYRTTNPKTTNPAVVRKLTRLGVGIVSLREITPSLEEVYLRVISDDWRANNVTAETNI